MKTPIAVAYGDGIGPEIMKATLHVLKEAGAEIEIHEVEIGEKMYLKGFTTGMDPKMWDTIRKTKAFLKAPITTPQGGGFKSLNVTVRTTLGLYANIRPCVSYFPFVETKHPDMDVVIVRENEEDLYAGIEYQQTPNVCNSIKIISRAGSEKIIRYAFEYAKSHGRKKVTCFSKDNIMKFSDGLFHKIFDEIALEYPDLLNEHWIVDIGAAKLSDTPEIFDVVVMPNLYGDILSDVAAQIAGSVGLAGSANIGDFGAMFEAIHGSAPRRAGQNIANPSGLMLAAIQMMAHINQPQVAERFHNAWLYTLEQGIHTYDIFKEGVSKKKVGTQEFADAIVHNLGKKPTELSPVSYTKITSPPPPSLSSSAHRELVGVDVYLYHKGSLQKFLANISHINAGPLHLQAIFNRGVKVWPQGQPETFCIEQWRCRFTSGNDLRPVSQNDVIQILHAFDHIHQDIFKSEFLYTLENKPAFT